MEVSKKISMKRVKTNDPNSVDIFINALKNNQIIAYPTDTIYGFCLLYTTPSPRDRTRSRMPSSA